MKTNLDKVYGWNGTIYGPGEVEVPDEMAQALLLKPEQEEEKPPAKQKPKNEPTA